MGSNTTNYTTNTLDQYTTLSGATNTTNTYDNDGNLVNDGQKTYKYDYNNRLIEVNIGTGNLVRYTYDILGRRTKKIDSSKSSTNPESTIYVYSGDNILSEYKTYSILVNGTGTLTPITLKKNYINSIGTDGILAYDAEEQISPTGTGKTTNRYYYHTNQLGSVIALTNSTGVIMQTYSYDAFGKAYVRNGSGSGTTLISLDTYTGSTYSNSRLYTGREYDKEIGMYYLRARYYNANTGKFISRDPVGQNDQVNLYTYVGNNPLKYVDRMGREKLLILIGIDEDGEEPEFDENGYMKVKLPSDPNDLRQGYIALQYNRVKKLNPKFDYKVVRNYQGFDDAVNEKQRDKVILIAHGFRGKIALNDHLFNKDKSTEISYRNLNNDTQTPEQQKLLALTELELLSCSTGDSSWSMDSIAEDMQEHYGFQVTRAPNMTIHDDGSIFNTGKNGDRINGAMVEFN